MSNCWPNLSLAREVIGTGAWSWCDSLSPYQASHSTRLVRPRGRPCAGKRTEGTSLVWSSLTVSPSPSRYSLSPSSSMYSLSLSIKVLSRALHHDTLSLSLFPSSMMYGSAHASFCAFCLTQALWLLRVCATVFLLLFLCASLLQALKEGTAVVRVWSTSSGCRKGSSSSAWSSTSTPLHTWSCAIFMEVLSIL